MKLYFYLFLFEKGALLRFLMNKRNETREEFKEKNLDNIPQHQWINDAFFWKETSEGFDHWKELSNRWSIFLVHGV